MNLKQSRPLLFTLGVGCLGFCLRLLLYRIGFDEKNILSSSHILHLLCLVLAPGLGIYLASALKQGKGLRIGSGHLLSLMLAAACCLAIHGLSLIREVDSLLGLARLILSLAGAVSIALCALTPREKQNLHTLCHALICAFFALDMLCRYQGWSGNPQLPDYVFQVFACIFLSLASYQRLAFDTGLGQRRALRWCSHMALCLCLFCAAGPETHIFYLGGALWALVCLLVPKTKRQ